MTDSKRLPWIIKYRPKRIDDVANQDEAKKLFRAWLESWLKGKPQKKAALLYGPPGTGKTSLVEAAAREYKLELIEMNASDFRRKEDIEKIAKVAATQSTLFGARGKIILLDEVDGISGTADRGGLDAILELINASRHPIVMTANDPWDQKLRPLRDAALMIPFNRLSKSVVVSVLRRICNAEKLQCEEEALEYIAERSEGDLRAAINDLQAIAEGTGRKVTLALARTMVHARYREYTPFEALRKLFTSKYAWQAKAAISSTNVDYDMMKQWINENIPYQYTDPEDIWRAYEALARADVYLGRIIKTQSWDLLSYVFDMMGAGVAMARRKSRWRWVKYQFPRKILMLAKTKEAREVRDAIARILASKLHISTAKARLDVMPYLQVIFRENPEYAARIALWLDLTDNMVKYLAGPRTNEVLAHLNKLKTPALVPATAGSTEKTATAEERGASTRRASRASTARRSSRRRSRSSGGQRTLF